MSEAITSDLINNSRPGSLPEIFILLSTQYILGGKKQFGQTLSVRTVV